MINGNSFEKEKKQQTNIYQFSVSFLGCYKQQMKYSLTSQKLFCSAHPQAQQWWFRLPLSLTVLGRSPRSISSLSSSLSSERSIYHYHHYLHHLHPGQYLHCHHQYPLGSWHDNSESSSQAAEVAGAGINLSGTVLTPPSPTSTNGIESDSRSSFKNRYNNKKYLHCILVSIFHLYILCTQKVKNSGRSVLKRTPCRWTTRQEPRLSSPCLPVLLHYFLDLFGFNGT